jgi:undecaprenyl diphosphate synthase
MGDAVKEAGPPSHVACIMDGNGRWALARGLPRSAGHAAGEVAMNAAIDGAIACGLGWLTLYAFSTENWKRPKSEVDFLFRLIGDIIDRNGEALHSRGVRIRQMGHPGSRLPAFLSDRIHTFERITEGNSGLTLTLAVDYGGRTELVDAANSLLERGEKIDDSHLSQSMYFPDMPDPDLIIRFGGERRLSNFMLWQAAYAELDFADMFWPDVRERHFVELVKRFERRTRRFGAISDSGA